ncbi:maltose permease [Penicillium daleae]|uniref:Maltose permease n=1 Tax=Penicillium daleae TaxID=63821 RepID=A0AAD6G5E5_9EURO|nr:maltose permease [Penicillium daleae]KAJ5455693.1 maltose permease [Penicillium daleae]
MGYSTCFFQQAGLNENQSFDIAMEQYALGAVGTMLSWGLMSRFGRRTLYLSGLGFQFIILLITGFLGLSRQGNSGASWAVAAMMVVYTFVYGMKVGPVCYALVPEIPASRLRTRTVVLGRNLYNVINIIMNITIPYMLNPTAWNWKAKAGFFYAGLAAFCFIWTFFRLSETKNRTNAELDILFENKVSALKFKDTEVDIFNIEAEVNSDDKAQAEHHEVTKS